MPTGEAAVGTAPDGRATLPWGPRLRRTGDCDMRCRGANGVWLWPWLGGAPALVKRTGMGMLWPHAGKAGLAAPGTTARCRMGDRETACWCSGAVRGVTPSRVPWSWIGVALR